MKLVLFGAWGACMLTLSSGGVCSAQCNDLVEQSAFPGVVSTSGTAVVRAAVEWDPDGVGPLQSRLVIGGRFSHAGTVASRGVAAWDGERWHAMDLPAQMTSVDTYALAVAQGQLYAGGVFAGGSSLVRWNGTAWEAPGGELDGSVLALCVHNGDLIAAGTVQHAGAVSVDRAARFDGAAWHALETGVFGASTSIRSLASWGTQLVMGGIVDTLRGAAAGEVVVWDGSSVQPLGNLSGTVGALAVHNGGVFAGTSGGSRLWRWDGVQWVPALAVAMNGEVRCLRSRAGSLYVGGSFNTPATFVGVWDGSSLQEGPDFSPTYALAEFRGLMVATGDATNSSVPIRMVAIETGAGVGVPSHGPYSTSNAFLPNISAFEPFGGGLVCAGTFDAAGANSTPNVALWTGSGWAHMGSLTTQSATWSPRVADVQVHSGLAYAAGKDVSVWDGSAWNVVGSVAAAGFGYGAYRLVSLPGGLVAAGSFSSIGGVPALNVAVYDGANWQPMGAGVAGDVSSMAVYQGQLVVGGSITSSPGAGALHNVAAWDGSQWQSLGGGTPALWPYKLLVWHGALLAGGSTSTSGPNIMAWDGQHWSPLHDAGVEGLGGVGTLRSVYDMVEYNSDLIAGGDFTTAGGGPATGLARWNGRSWTAINDYAGALSQGRCVTGLTVYNGELWVSGWLTNDGTVPSGAGTGVYLGRFVDTGSCPPCDSIDFNQDLLFPDAQDITDFLLVFAGGTCPTASCNDIDFNNDDVFPDTEDIQALLRVFAGGTCG
ncbi:MAG: hypothetical protein U0637_01280 [Phycisphaerales bacterium]